jgi:hypothetical protein
MARWHYPVLFIVAILFGAYLVTKFPQVNVLGKVLP